MMILAVDDSKIIRRIVSGVIETAGYQPISAGNGAEALDLLEANPDEVAMVLLDWNMPVMDGMECLKAIRANPSTESIPVMMVTTESERESMVEAIQAGANNYCAKPFTPETLVTKILECLGLGL